MRDVVTFRSDLFNLAEEKDYFLNPACFGDDLARWLIAELKYRGIVVEEEPRQEDFGWDISYAVDGVRYSAVIGNVEKKSWFIVVERQRSLLASLLFGRHKGVSSGATNVINTVLLEEPRIKDILWFYWEQFRQGRLSNGKTTPDG